MYKKIHQEIYNLNILHEKGVFIMLLMYHMWKHSTNTKYIMYVIINK